MRIRYDIRVTGAEKLGLALLRIEAAAAKLAAAMAKAETSKA